MVFFRLCCLLQLRHIALPTYLTPPIAGYNTLFYYSFLSYEFTTICSIQITARHLA